MCIHYNIILKLLVRSLISQKTTHEDECTYVCDDFYHATTPTNVSCPGLVWDTINCERGGRGSNLNQIILEKQKDAFSITPGLSIFSLKLTLVSFDSHYYFFAVNTRLPLSSIVHRVDCVALY